MAKATRATGAVPATDATDVSARLVVAEQQLAAALMSGADTRPIRAAITAIKKEIADKTDTESAKRAELERTEHEAIADRARTIASEASVRFSQTLDGLAPPPSPF